MCLKWLERLSRHAQILFKIEVDVRNDEKTLHTKSWYGASMRFGVTSIFVIPFSHRVCIGMNFGTVPSSQN